MNALHRILIVDDSAANRLILSRSLRKAGYETIEATDGEAALRLAIEHHPDIILLDVMMEGQDGFEVCRALKAREATASIPVIFVIALTEAKNVDDAFAAGGSDFITKPFRMDEIKARVSVHLQLREARSELELAHTQLLRAQKLESIGQLAAGIAHEINTPAQYLGDNIRFLKDSFADLAPLLEKTRELIDAADGGLESRAIAAELRDAFDTADVAYLSREIPRAIEQSIDGVARITKIVGAMKEFSHPGVTEMTEVDLNRVVENSVIVATAEWKLVASMDMLLDPALPLVFCQPNDLSQVILNLVVNAAHAIDGAGRGQGTIGVRTRLDGDVAEIRISDTGAGIPEAIRGKIFDAFFTTKGVGKGTGQGLAIAHSVVEQLHRGTITFETELGKGTTFVVRLPLRGPAVKAAA